MKQTVNSVYGELFTTKKRYVILMGGRGAGRSTVASQFLLSKLMSPDYVRAAVMRGIYSQIRQSAWKELSDRVGEQEVESRLRIVENEMEMNFGQNSLKAHGFRASSSSQTARLKSLASYNTVWIEEAEEVGESEFMTLDDTLRTKRGDIIIILTLNPPQKNHWIIRRWFDCEPAYEKDGSLIKGFYKAKLKKDADDVLFINTNYEHNIDNLDKETVKRYEDYKKIEPERYYQAIRGLVPEVASGRIYHGWKQIDEVPHEARLVRRGLDFGWFPDPMCLVDIYYYNGGYIIDEQMYGTEIKNKTVAEYILTRENKDTIVAADSAEPKSIDEVKEYGVNITGVPKGRDSVKYGINIVAGLRISVTKRSVNVWESYENYAWKEDKDGKPRGYPDHEYSHAMDAIRYAMVDLIATGLTPEQEKANRMSIMENRVNYLENQKRRFSV